MHFLLTSLHKLEERASKTEFFPSRFPLLAHFVFFASVTFIKTLLVAGSCRHQGVLDRSVFLISPLPGEINRADEGGFYQHVGGITFGTFRS